MQRIGPTLVIRRHELKERIARSKKKVRSIQAPRHLTLRRVRARRVENNARALVCAVCFRNPSPIFLCRKKSGRGVYLCAICKGDAYQRCFGGVVDAFDFAVPHRLQCT